MSETEERVAKIKIAQSVDKYIIEKKLTLKKAAKRCGVPYQKIDDIRYCRLGNYSIDRLNYIFTTLRGN